MNMEVQYKIIRALLKHIHILNHGKIMLKICVGFLSNLLTNKNRFIMINLFKKIYIIKILIFKLILIFLIIIIFKI